MQSDHFTYYLSDNARRVRMEIDPHGKDQHETGAKLDAGKPRMSLVVGGFSRAIEAVAEIGTYGAQKYTDNGWMDVPNGIERYKDAMMRHLFAFEKGETYDKDSELEHLAHMAWNALAVLELQIRKDEEAYQLKDNTSR